MLIKVCLAKMDRVFSVPGPWSLNSARILILSLFPGMRSPIGIVIMQNSHAFDFEFAVGIHQRPVLFER